MEVNSRVFLEVSFNFLIDSALQQDVLTIRWRALPEIRQMNTG